MKTQATLNLSRKWRSKQFDAVIGQELPIRILQNSLYVNQFFPVYLFSGQRGCGKTTSARLFAAAVNCEVLPLFQQKPREHKIPCLVCPSCLAMSAGSHPDFVEIDAASYTGVDNVRTIIESASLLPVLGRKKVYLIDEAHMLSKAAFNAFLKILEEPPASVVFMLATTDPHKIIDTVRSRCFQLFFSAIAPEVIANHLEHICKEEAIPYERSGLMSIASETEGSARDAINLLEQVRFSTDRVTTEAVLALLGHLPEAVLLDLFEHIMAADVQGLIGLLQSHSLERYAPLAVWQKSCEMVRAFLFIKQGVQRTMSFQEEGRIIKLAKTISEQELVFCMQQLYRYEQLLLKSTVQFKLLELLFIELAQRGSISTSKGVSEQKVKEPVVPTRVVSNPPVSAPVTPLQEPVQSPVTPTSDSRWAQFSTEMSTVSDPLLQTIFRQLRFVRYNEDTQRVVVILVQESTIFTQWLQEGKALWSPALERAFGKGASLEVQFDTAVPENRKKVVEQEGIKKVSIEQRPATSGTAQGQKPAWERPVREAQKKQQPLKKEDVVDVSDSEKWQKAHFLQELFGGAVVQVPEEEKKHDETEQ